MLKFTLTPSRRIFYLLGSFWPDVQTCPCTFCKTCRPVSATAVRGPGGGPPLKARRTSPPPAPQTPHSTFTTPFSYPSPPSPPSPHHHRHRHPFCCLFVLPDFPKPRKSIPKPPKNGPGTLPEKTSKIRRQKRLKILENDASQT